MKRFLLALALALPAAAGGPWWRVRSSQFEVYTDAGETAGRHVLDRLLEMRRIFRKEWPDSAQPIRVLLFASEADYSALKPADPARAFFQSGSERDYIVARAGTADTARAASHEYVHAVLHHTSVTLPRWLEEGLADFFSTAEIRKNAGHIGEPVREHVVVLERAKWLDAPALAAVTVASPEYKDARRAGVFYAESWALVHMLMLEPGWRGGLAGFLARLADGEEPDEAFEAAFAKTMAEAVRDATGYVRRGRLPTEELALDAEPAAAPATSEQLPDQEGRLVPAEVALLAGRPDYAEQLYQSLARDFPNSPASATGLATLALQRSDYDTARRQLARAIELGARDAPTYLEYAMLIRDTNGSRAEVRKYLEQAVAANPRHPEAQFLLGLMDASDKDFDAAIRHYRAAVDVLPRQSSFWHALAMAYVEIGQRPAAREAARHALETAALPHEREMAEAALSLAAAPLANPAARAGGGVNVVVPESWKGRKPDHRMQGKLVEVECRPDGVRFHIEGDSEKVVLTASQPNDIELRNFPAANKEFRCGAQKDLRVVAEYSSDNDLISLELLR